MIPQIFYLVTIVLYEATQDLYAPINESPKITYDTKESKPQKIMSNMPQM